MPTLAALQQEKAQGWADATVNRMEDEEERASVGTSANSSENDYLDDMYQSVIHPTTLLQQLGLVEETTKGQEKKIMHTTSMDLVQYPTKVRRGRCVKKFLSSREYVVSVKFKLDSMPTTRCNIMQFSLAGGLALETHIPSISVKPGRMDITILSGKNFHDHSQPVCSCQIRGKPKSLFCTFISSDPHAPTWGTHQSGVDELGDGEELEFLVWDKAAGKGRPMGRAVLTKFLIYPNGYEGELQLQLDQKGSAINVLSGKAPHIYVKVKVETACRVVVMMRQGDRQMEIHGPEGLHLKQEVTVDFSLHLADSPLLGSDAEYEEDAEGPTADARLRLPKRHQRRALNQAEMAKSQAQFEDVSRHSTMSSDSLEHTSNAMGRFTGVAEWTNNGGGDTADKKELRHSVSGVERYVSAVDAHVGRSLKEAPASWTSPKKDSPRGSSPRDPDGKVGTRDSPRSMSSGDTTSRTTSTSGSPKPQEADHMDESILGPPLEYIATLQIGEFFERTSVKLRLPTPSKMWVYLCSPREPAPLCLVTMLKYTWIHIDSKSKPKIDSNEVSFDMPRREAVMLHRARELLETNRRWRLFDSLFGSVLILNGLVIGLHIHLNQTDPDLVADHTWTILDRTFLGIFIVELILRLIIMGRKWYQNIDHWLVFDFFVILISIFGILSEGALQLPFPVSVLRLLRLLKLAKMVRLVRAFKALGALVEAMINSVETLIWTMVLLGFTLFIGAVFTVNVVTWIYSKSEENIPYHLRDKILPWFKVSGAMWRFLLMTTYDGWAEEIRVFAFESTQYGSEVVAFAMLAVWSVSAFGISNMVVGLMCHTAFELGQRNMRMSNAHLLDEKRKVLAKFRRILKSYGQRPIFKSDAYISVTELVDMVMNAFALKRHGQADPWDFFDDTGEDFDDADFQHKLFETIKHYIDTLELTSHDFMSLAAIFAEEGEIEIDGMVEALAIIQLQRYFTNLNTMEAMTFGNVPLAIRPIDVLFFNHVIEENEIFVSASEQNIMGLAAATLDILNQLNNCATDSGIIDCFHKNTLDVSHRRLEIKAELTTKTIPDRVMGIGPLVRYIKDYKKVAALGSLSLPVDAVFGFFIMINGVFMAFQAADEEDEYDNLFYVIDLIFTTVFGIEIAFRAMMFVTIEEDLYNNEGGTIIHEEEAADEDVGGIGTANIQTGEEYDMQKIKDYRSRFRFIVVPPCPKRGGKGVLLMFPAFLSQPAIFFDFFVVVILAIDLMILEAMRRTGLFTVDAGVLSVLRVFRLTRLAKLLRILKLFPQLQKLLYVLVSTGRLIMWTVLILCIFLYMVAIVFVLLCSGYKADTAGEALSAVNESLSGVNATNETMMRLADLPSPASARWDSLHMLIFQLAEAEQIEFAKEAIYLYFGQLLDGTISGWQLITLDDWDDIFDMMLILIPLACLIIAAIIVVGLMMMNMAVGVMCASSIGLVRRSQDEHLYEDLVVFLQSMGEIDNLFERELGSQTLTSEMLGDALELDMRQTNFRPDKRHDGKVMRDLADNKQEKARSPEFISELRAIFKKAKLVPVTCKNVFETLDYEKQGFIPLNVFIQGALVMREDLAKLDMFSCASGVRKVRNKTIEATQRMAHCHYRLELLLENMKTLVLRLDHEREAEFKPFKASDHADLQKLSESAHSAIQSLVSSKTQGPMTTKKLSATWSSSKGTGLIQEAEDLSDGEVLCFEGIGTIFKHEVDVGDILVIEASDKQAKMQKHDGGADHRNKAGTKNIPAVVTAIMSNTLLKCRLGEGAVNRDSWENFHVVKMRKEETKLINTLDMSNMHFKAPRPHSHPNHSQSMFEWQVQSRKLEQAAMEYEEKMVQAAEKTIDDSNVSYHVKQASKLVDFTLGHTPRLLQDLVHETEYQEHELLIEEYKDSLEILFMLMDRAMLQKCWKAWWWCWYNNPDNIALSQSSQSNLKKRFGQKLKIYAGVSAPEASKSKTHQAEAVQASMKGREDARNYLRAKAATGAVVNSASEPPAKASSAELPVAIAALGSVPVKFRQQPLAKARVVRKSKARADASRLASVPEAGETQV